MIKSKSNTLLNKTKNFETLFETTVDVSKKQKNTII